MSNDQVKNLARLIHVKKQDNPYVVLLGSGLSMTSDLLKELGYKDRSAFDTQMQPRSPNEWYSLLKEPFEKLPLQEGYHCLAHLLKAGYFNVILTANFDPLLEQALDEVGILSQERDLLINGEHKTSHIINSLKSLQPRIKVCLLRGRLQAKTIPNITGNLQFDKDLQEILQNLLKEDMIVLGASERDIAVNRCIPAEGGSIWYVTNESTASHPMIRSLQLSRSGETVTGSDGNFNNFFLGLEQQIAILEPKVASKHIDDALITPVDQSYEPSARNNNGTQIITELESNQTSKDRDNLQVTSPDRPDEQVEAGSNESIHPIPILGTGKHWGVMVGIADYEDQSSYGHHEAYVKDAEMLYQQLALNSFHPSRLQLFTGYPSLLPNHQAVLSQLRETASATDPDDVLLFYFSGLVDKDDNDTYLITSNSLPTDLQHTAVPMLAVEEIMMSAKAQAKIMILDLWHSEVSNSTESNAQRTEKAIHTLLERSKGITVLAAHKEAYEQTQCSTFTSLLAESIKSKSAFGFSKGTISAAEICNSLEKEFHLYRSKSCFAQNSIFCRYYKYDPTSYLIAAYLYLVKALKALEVGSKILNSAGAVDQNRCRRVLELLYQVEEIPPLEIAYPPNEELILRDRLYKISQLVYKLTNGIVELKTLAAKDKKCIKNKFQVVVDASWDVSCKVVHLVYDLRKRYGVEDIDINVSAKQEVR